MASDNNPFYEAIGRRFRALAARGIDKAGVDRENRIIRGFSVITEGELLGHAGWADEVLLDQVVEAGNAKPNGVKVRFTHPGLSADGMGKALGVARNFRRDGERSIADLHLLSKKTADSAPDGDLGEHVMNLAEESPNLFGASIVLFRDYGEEQRFSGLHSDEDGFFRSPDERNANSYTHWRLSKLTAADVVDEPAANPNGFLSDGEEVADLAERALTFAFGLSSVDPGHLAPGLNAVRVRQFVSEFLARRGLELKEKSMSTQDTKPAAPENKGAALSELKGKYGQDPGFVIEQFELGATLEQAELAWLKKENARLSAEKAEAEKAKLAAEKDKGEAEQKRLAAEKDAKAAKDAEKLGADPMPFGGESKVISGGEFMNEARQLSREQGVSMRQAMSQLSREKPELHEAFKGAMHQRRRKTKRRG